MIRDF